MTANEVRTLFNHKAACWQSKYGQTGSLNSRLERFRVRLSELCPPPDRVLDFGCGTGEMATAIEGIGYRVAACDIAERMIEVARRARYQGFRHPKASPYEDDRATLRVVIN